VIPFKSRPESWCILEINEGGVEGDTLGKSFIESFGSGGGRKPRSSMAAMEREDKKEKKRRKKKEAPVNRYRRHGASLVGTLLWYKRVSNVDALQSMWLDPQV
jgi:hypothetical protein